MITSPLIQAILDGEIDTVRNLIKSNPELMNIPSEIGSLPYKIAENKGLANQQTALLRANAKGAENFEKYSDLLIHYLGDLSHEFGCASWFGDIEFILWEIIFENKPFAEDAWGFNDLDEETKEDLRFLSKKCEGWAAFIENDTEFVPMKKWSKMWNEYLQIKNIGNVR